ncbi:MAG: radical SAM domain-containing protein [Candidatus Berkelbacteria bacterium Licking1014_7]|uniref:Radical SAM domain-containing protein n=1 Tax=Candidatus Berkelbacteria bacterium Licking1014_7 TaxID=2017147 RepID=A0A554LI69_9BACT|nr:MAG: radical SAM domain-containing protein [Candidatus Berkelbacteria bacterium Licking1014_7]
MNQVVTHNSRLWRRNHDGTGLVFTHRQGKAKFLHLNAPGIEIFTDCQGDLSKNNIVKKWSGALQIDERFVREFLRQLQEQQAVTIGELCLDHLPPNWENENQQTTDILLIVPPNPFASREEIPLPLGVLMLASALKQVGFSVALFDMFLHNLDPIEIVKAVKKYKPSIIGISVITASAPSAYQVIKCLKTIDFAGLLIVGGIHATHCPTEVLQQGANVVVRGEGTYALCQLARLYFDNRAWDTSFLQSIPNIHYWHGDKIQKSLKAVNTSISSADDLPQPDRNIIDINNYPQKGAIISTFGCNRRCRFCTARNHPLSSYLARKPDRIIAELHEMERLGICVGNFVDDSFLLDHQRVETLCRMILQTNLNMAFACQAKVDDACKNPSTLKKMVEAGFSAIEFGVESGNQAVLRWTRKGITLEQAARAVDAAHNAGFQRISCGMIIGYPIDTRETIEDTIQFAIHLLSRGAHNIPLAICTPFPGSDIANNADTYGIKIVCRDWSRYNFREAVMDTPMLTHREIEQLYLDGLYRIHCASVRKGG